MLRILCALFCLTFHAANAQTLATKTGDIRVETVAQGFETPWSLAFLPGGHALLSEREGRLWLLDGAGQAQPLSGLPEVVPSGQGGLLEVLVARDFATSRHIFLSHTVRHAAGGTGLAITRAQLSRDQTTLQNPRRIFEMTPGASGGRHFGGRMVQDASGRLFFTIGDRGADATAQDITRHNGSVLRINSDGTVPRDNPLVGLAGAVPELYSVGHRNPQGLAFDAKGQLWAHEHGARGGDEINRILPGRNYGWPVISYGTHYSGLKIGVGTARAGMEQPVFYWDPSIAPSGLVIYSGRLWPDWAGQFLVGSLNSDMIIRLAPGGTAELERISAPQTARVRDLREAPDGSLWMLSEGNGGVYRLTPAR